MAECELRHCQPLRHQCPQFLRCVQPDIEWNAGEGFADIEGSTRAIIVAIVVGHERTGLREFAGEQATRKRHARDDRDASSAGEIEEQFRRPLPKHVDDDLDADDVRELNGLYSFLDLLDADAAMSEFAGACKVVEDRENLRRGVDLG
jgi:hypothetical protein